MLNMNVYGKRRELSRFRFGFDFLFGGLAFNRYTGGEIRGRVNFLTLISPGTGHFPFTVFGLDFLTGEKHAYQIQLFGLTIGAKIMHDLAEDGTINGPDKLKHYWYFSCLNHQHKLVEEII